MRVSFVPLVLLGGCSLVTSLDGLSGPDASMSPDGPAIGTLGGPCYANSTCNAGLACELVSGTGVCVSPDSGMKDASVDAPADVTLGDVTTPPLDDSGCKTPHGPYEADAGPYCPYLADGGAGYCGASDHCCLPAAGIGPSSCISNAATCTWLDASAKNADFRCNESGDCNSGSVCCLTAPGLAQQQAGCSGYYTAGNVLGTMCAVSCGTQPQICGENADCSGGKTCYPFALDGFWIGVCE